LKAYKLFNIKNGKLYPLYINANLELPVDTKLVAESGELLPSGKVKSKLGGLAYRPGWHCCEYPLADHIGKRINDKLYQRKNSVWCEIEILGEKDYTAEAKKENSRDSYLKYIPENGYYWYQTNPNAKVRWLIAGEIKINRILSNEEVAKLCRSAGFEPQEIEK